MKWGIRKHQNRDNGEMSEREGRGAGTSSKPNGKKNFWDFSKPIRDVLDFRTKNKIYILSRI